MECSAPGSMAGTAGHPGARLGSSRIMAKRPVAAVAPPML